MNYGDILLWMGVSTAFFRAMDTGFRTDDSGAVRFCTPSWASSVAKAAIVVAPLVLRMFAPEYRNTPIWDVICLAGIAVVVGPIAFPQLTVELQERSLTEKIGYWLMSRFDIAVKKGILIFILSLLLSKVPLQGIAQFIAIPHYFTPADAHPTGPLTVALLVVGFVSLAMRAMVVLAISKILSFSLLPLAAMLLGYVMDLGGSIHPPNESMSLGLFYVVGVDLFAFLAAQWGPK